MSKLGTDQFPSYREVKPMFIKGRKENHDY